MTVTMHNERAFKGDKRQFCSHCGTEFYAWGHDGTSMGRSGRAKYCSEHGSQSWVMLRVRPGDGFPKGSPVPPEHIHRCNGQATPTEVEVTDGDDSTDDSPAAAPVPAPVAAAAAPVAAPAVNPAVAGLPPAALAAAAAFADAMANAAPAAVDESQVREIVKSELAANGAGPLRIEIVDRATQDVRQLDGTVNAAMPDILMGVNCGQNILMVGPMGTGKSHMAEQVAEALGQEIREISLTPQTSKADLFGYMSASGNYVRTAFRDWWEFGGVFHFDELDNGHASIMAGINAAMAKVDKKVAYLEFPDGRVKKHAITYGLASANTYGRGPDRTYLRQPLDGATMDRFEPIPVEYDEQLEKAVCLSTGLDEYKVDQVLKYIRHLRKVAETNKMPLPFGMRRSTAVCRWLKAGQTVDKAIEFSVRRGISDTDWKKVSVGAPFLG